MNRIIDQLTPLTIGPTCHTDMCFSPYWTTCHTDKCFFPFLFVLYNLTCAFGGFFASASFLSRSSLSLCVRLPLLLGLLSTLAYLSVLLGFATPRMCGRVSPSPMRSMLLPPSPLARAERCCLRHRYSRARLLSSLDRVAAASWRHRQRGGRERQKRRETPCKRDERVRPFQKNHRSQNLVGIFLFWDAPIRRVA